MAWIESHQTLGRHPKLLKLAVKLRIHRAQAIGHLQYLWWWALDYAPTGDVSALAPAEISAASEWQGDPSLFQNSLVDCGWIDSDGKIHDWMEYAGRLVEERRKDAERKRESRMASAGRPPDGGRTAPVPNPTVPNPTVPNPTVPNPTKPKECGLKRSVRTVVGFYEGGVEGTKRQTKTNPRALGTNPIGLGTNPRAFGTNQKATIKGIEIAKPPENDQAVERMIEFSGEETSRRFFQKAVRALGGGLCEEAVGEVRMRDANGSVNNRGKYLVSVLSDWMRARGEFIGAELKRFGF